MYWDVIMIGKAIYGEGLTERQKEDVRKELKKFLKLKGFEPKEFFRFIPGRGQRYFIPDKLAREFIREFYNSESQNNNIVINEEYIKSGKSIQKELEDFKKELAKIMLD